MDSHRYCPRCGWPDAQPYEVVSRHQTTEGVIVYSRCVCGRLQVRHAGRVAIRQTGPALQTVEPTGLDGRRGADVPAVEASTALVRSAASAAACLVGLVSVAFGAVTLPAPALLSLGALSLFVGALAWVGTWIVHDSTGGAARAALTAFGAAGVAGLALAGLLVTFGATSVVLIPLLTVLGGLAWRVLSRPDDEDAAAGTPASLPGGDRDGRAPTVEPRPGHGRRAAASNTWPGS